MPCYDIPVEIKHDFKYSFSKGFIDFFDIDSLVNVVNTEVMFINFFNTSYCHKQ